MEEIENNKRILNDSICPSSFRTEKIDMGGPQDTQELELNKSLSNEEKQKINRLETFRIISLKQLRAVTFQIRINSNGLSLSKISQMCGWDKSRLSQILTKWDDPETNIVPKSHEKQREIFDKLNKCLESFNRTTKKGDENNDKIM